jgi:hypothetical protein
MKITKHSLDHIELIASGDTALFEIRLIVAMKTGQMTKPMQALTRSVRSAG